MKLPVFILLLLFVSTIISCKKEHYITSSDALISLTSDTLFFDTVFTSSGSVTKSFKIINENDRKLRLSSVKLAGGSASAFKINIDGVAATEAINIDINAGDSMYVFVQVNADPNSQKLPFILEDSIGITFNGNTRWMQLRAHGQNAVFLKNYTISSDAIWKDSLPIVISGFVKIDSGVTLNITEGTRVYLHADAPVLVNGTLKAEGSVLNPVIFSGDRTDEEYRDLPAAWPGIYFNTSSTDNILKHVVIKNAYQGIIVQNLSLNANPKITLSQSVITNIYDAGILAINSSIAADNCLIINCGSNIALLLGGDYSFIHCTVATYGSTFITHKNPVLQVADYFEQDNTTYTADLAAQFTNCIFWGDNGNVDNEIFAGKKGSGTFNVAMNNCLYKAKDPLSNVMVSNSILNQPPLFDSINVSKNIYDFHISSNPLSPAVNAGMPTPFLYDLDGKLRDGQPDIGCYER